MSHLKTKYNMQNKKKTLAKRKYTKPKIHWKQKVKQVAAIDEPTTNQQELLSFILSGIDRLETASKARVFAYILGKEQLNENQFWAVQKVLS